MSDEEAINAALSALHSTPSGYALLRRNGRPFVALPTRRVAALHTLRLYQPQRLKARWFTSLMQFVVLAGLHRLVLPRFRHAGGKVRLDPEFGGCLPGTAGVMLGSPEHRVRRAILSYQTADGWEVAKLAFGDEGRAVIEGEYAALNSMPSASPGIPQALGVHHGGGFSILRLPYFQGRPLQPRQNMRGLDLLESWTRDLPARPASDFPEWPAIRSALETSDEGNHALARIAGLHLRPVIRHGDFARWNLLERDNGKLVAIDWEWGHPAGMPGIDLVHLFAQDARLVHQLVPDAVVRAVEHALSAPRCREYLKQSGWGDDVRDVILAGIAFTVGARQQANEEVLEAALGNR
jgi:hypothetical protein